MKHCSTFRPGASFWGAVLLLTAAASASAQQKQTINITGYTINAQLSPSDHKLSATAQVTFTALDNTDTAIFELHGALKVEKVTTTSNLPLSGERGPNATVIVTPTTPLVKGQQYTYIFTYDGMLDGDAGSPVEGLKLAQVGDPTSYLLYAGRWFPMVGYMTDRFTADIHVTLPAGYRVIGSGPTTSAPGAGGEQHNFHWSKPGFPGTIIAGKFDAPVSPASNIHVYAMEDKKQSAQDYGQTALREFAFFTSTFGVPESTQLNVVELPNDTVPAAWAPEIAAIAGSRIGNKNDFRLLSNTIAHQWWGSEISPATLNDAWITNGMSRYGELMYLEDTAGRSAMNAAILDVSSGALAYDTIPLTSAGRLDAFSPQFQSMTLEKGGLVYHMLRWEVGNDSFSKILRATLSQFTDKSIRTSDFEKLAEAQSQQQLTPFFAQWLDGTGAPQFNNKYAVYRLGNNKGFRTIGEIQQDLDLFNMPVELRIETDGKTEIRRVDVVGSDSQFVVDTFGRPRHITIDPDNWILKNSPDMQVRIHILRGQQLVAQGDTTGGLAEYQNALKANPNSSLASYRIGEVLFTMRNYQAAINSYRDALRGDDDPKWTEVWSHIQIGKIFDVTGQRERAVPEYRQALQTNDNTQGALNEARKYLQTPYKREENE
ncbi:peptidase M1 [Alloacidobacterium dinghuense]|uniref:Peptidase M1 n=2 Tax=Alloacidobacterium dinghuense TaxID=2763107 RepID=A0A7G8BQU8_9BACT|nr:peptidase M1 [Alloacidobacterium dinghuense]